jgi:hypothetical protein
LGSIHDLSTELGQYGRAFADEVLIAAADLSITFPREAQPGWCLELAEAPGCARPVARSYSFTRSLA